MKAWRLAGILALGSVLGGCATVQPYDFTEFHKTPPRSILIVPVVNRSLDVDAAMTLRDSDAERFVDVVHRIGIEPFKSSVYGNPDQKSTDRLAALAA